MTHILYISEYTDVPNQAGNLIQCGTEPAIAVQNIPFSTHAESAAFNAATRFVRLHTNAICSYKFGLAPVAATTDPRMPADHTEIYGVIPGQGYKVSVIDNT